MSDSNQFYITIQSVSLDWVPAPGQIATVGLNTLNSQAPVLGGVQTNPAGVMDAWSGMAYAETYGSLGSIVIYGGGHGDYPYNEVYRYDVASREWSRITDPVYPIYIGPDGYYGDATYREYYTSTDGSSVSVGQVVSDHAYGNSLWLPEGSLGSDQYGYFFRPGVSSPPPLGGASKGSSWPHYVPLSSPVWTRGNEALGAMPFYGCAIYDSSRNRVIQFPSSDFLRTARTFDCSTQTAGTLAISAPGTRTYYATGAYDSDADLYLIASSDVISSGASLQMVNPNTGEMKYATIGGVSTAGLTQANETGGWDWVQAWGAFIYYPGSGQVVYKLKKPADAWNGTWGMSSQSFGGDAALASNGRSHISRFRYASQAGCFLWASKTSNPVQAFNVEAP